MKKVSDYSTCILERHFIWELLEKWKPRSFAANEKAQENDLAGWLQSKLGGVPMIQQYGIARASADIIIQDTYLIELKLALDYRKKGELDRCVGQLEYYKQKWVDCEKGPVYLVVVGVIDPEVKLFLKKAIDRLDSGNMTQWFFLMNKIPDIEA